MYGTLLYGALFGRHAKFFLKYAHFSTDFGTLLS